MELIKTSTWNKLPLEKTNYYGNRYKDTKVFDDEQEIGNLIDYSLNKIKIWYGNATEETMLNGIQLQFKHRISGRIIKTPERYGNHHLLNSVEFVLHDDEYIVSAIIWAGAYVGRIEFLTNKNRSISAGGFNCNRYYHWVGSESKYVIDMKDKVLVGTFGGHGGHFHGVGLYLAPKSEYLNHFKLFYFLVRLRMKNHDGGCFIKKIAEDFHEGRLKELNLKNALGYTFTLPTHIFACILSYV